MAFHWNLAVVALAASLFVTDAHLVQGRRYGEGCLWGTLREAGFRCFLEDNNSTCIMRFHICNRAVDCSDGFDERDCGCGLMMFRCKNMNCVPSNAVCNFIDDCGDRSDEICQGYMTRGEIQSSLPWYQATTPEDARKRLVKWFLQRKSALGWSMTEKLPRIATALYLGQPELFTLPNDTTAHEMGKALGTYKLKWGEKSQELAAIVQAMLVTCVQPLTPNLVSRNAVHLVTELKKEGRCPLTTLAICNAGKVLEPEYVEYVRDLQDYHTTDHDALLLLTLACLSNRGLVEERELKELGEVLKSRQLDNGTVDGNLRSTALTLQALYATNNWEEGFNEHAALNVLIQAQQEDGSIGSFLDSYYALPALARTSLANISDSHCTLAHKSGEDVESTANHITVPLSVWVDTEEGVTRTFRVKVAPGTTVYQLIETYLNAKYRVWRGKPYLSSLYGLENDDQMALSWNLWLRTPNQLDLEIQRNSPVDVIVDEREVVLWYRYFDRTQRLIHAREMDQLGPETAIP